MKRFIRANLKAIKKAPRVREQALLVRKMTGKSVAAQLREIRSLRHGPGRLDPLEYYEFGLYDDARFSPSAKREFLGKQRNREIDRLLNNPQWRSVADSKLVTHAFLTGLGLPTPKIYALYYRKGRSLASVPCFRTPEAMADFLRNGMRYPVFAKPSRSHFGEGAFRINSFDREADRLRLNTGEEIGVEAFLLRLAGFPSTKNSGYLFQEPIAQHPEITRICGSCVASVRMLVLVYDDGPRLLRAAWRIPVGQAVTDNFVHGASGNMGASVNPDTGVVERAVRGVGATIVEAEAHPDSGLPLRGMRLPHWEAAVSTCLDAAAALPRLQFQHWDVAIGQDGPVLIELNYSGGHFVSQVAGRRGLLTTEFLDFVRTHAKRFQTVDRVQPAMERSKLLGLLRIR